MTNSYFPSITITLRREAKAAGELQDIDSIMREIEAKEAARTHVTIEVG